MNADLSKDFSTKRNFTKNGKLTLVQFIYPWLPARCHTYEKWGHKKNVCVLNNKDGTKKFVADITQEGIKAKETEEEGSKKENTIERKENEVKQTLINKVAKEVIEVEEGEIVKGWSHISPGKASRSPKTKPLEYGQVRIATPSWFSALVDVVDNGDLINKTNVKDEKKLLERKKEKLMFPVIP